MNPALDWLAEMSADEFRAVFRGSPIRRTKRSGLRRNVAIAIGNSKNRELLPLLDTMTADEDPSVSEAARWAKAKIMDLLGKVTAKSLTPALFALYSPCSSLNPAKICNTSVTWFLRFAATNLCLKGS